MHKLPIPEQAPDLSRPTGYDVAAHRAALWLSCGLRQLVEPNQHSCRLLMGWTADMTTGVDSLLLILSLREDPPERKRFADGHRADQGHTNTCVARYGTSI
jgi:hypothetical protein